MSSFSSLSSMVGCKRKSILNKAFRKFERPNENLLFGTAFHLTQEEGLEAGIQFVRDKIHEKKSHYIELLKEMYLRQFEFMRIRGVDMLAHEIPFDISLEGTDESFRGYIDGLAEYNGELWLVEFKTAKSINVDHVAIDSQITAYLWACQQEDLVGDVAGVLYIVNRKAKAKPPVILKSGGLSTAKSQGCSLRDYVDKAIELYGEPNNFPEKVSEFIDWLEQNDKPMIEMVAVKRTQSQIDEFGKNVMDFMRQEHEIKTNIDKYGYTEVLRTTPCFPTKMCFQFCDYKKECKAMLLDTTIDIDKMTEGEYEETFDDSNANL